MLKLSRTQANIFRTMPIFRWKAVFTNWLENDKNAKHFGKLITNPTLVTDSWTNDFIETDMRCYGNLCTIDRRPRSGKEKTFDFFLFYLIT